MAPSLEPPSITSPSDPDPPSDPNAPSSTTSSNPLPLLATYTNTTTTPHTTHKFTQPLPALPTSSNPSTPYTKEKTAYLSALRSSVITLQGEINTFLTGKMEEDKILATKAGEKVEDVVKEEEEGYGEDEAELGELGEGV